MPGWSAWRGVQFEGGNAMHPATGGQINFRRVFVKYNIVTWNMQGSGKNLGEQLGSLFLNVCKPDFVNIICLQEFGSPEALTALSDVATGNGYLCVQNVVQVDGDTMEADVRYLFATNGLSELFTFRLRVSWYEGDDNQRCGVGMLYQTSENSTESWSLETFYESFGRRPVIRLNVTKTGFSPMSVLSVHAIANESDSVSQIRNLCREVADDACERVWDNGYFIIGGDFNQTPEAAARVEETKECRLEYPLSNSNDRTDEAYIYRTGKATQGKRGARCRELDFFIVNAKVHKNINDFKMETCGTNTSDHDCVSLKFNMPSCEEEISKVLDRFDYGMF